MPGHAKANELYGTRGEAKASDPSEYSDEPNRVPIKLETHRLWE